MKTEIPDQSLVKAAPVASASTQLVERYFGAFARGDVDGALNCVHVDAVWHVDGDPAVTTVGIIQGRAAIREWLKRFPNGFTPISFKVERLIGDACDVIAIGRFRHQVLPTTTIVDSDFVIRFTVRDGLIARYQILEDSLLIAQARTNISPGRAARINGTVYGWSDTGAGRPLLFLHGLFLDRSFWRNQIEALETRWRCIAFDMPGHGVSGWREGLDLDQIASDMALWLAENDARAATIVGHSQGGMIALRIAARYPELVDRLVLVNSSARAEPAERLPVWRERRAGLLAGGDSRARALQEVQRFTTAPQWLASHAPEAEAEHAQMMRNDPALVAQALDAAIFTRGDVRHLLPRIDVPVTVLSGALDRATGPGLGEEIAERVPHGRSIIVPAVAHHLPTEAPAVLIDAIDGASPVGPAKQISHDGPQGALR